MHENFISMICFLIIPFALRPPPYALRPKLLAKSTKLSNHLQIQPSFSVSLHDF